MNGEEFLALARLASRQVAAVALRFQDRVTNEDKGGATPESAALTLVDLAAQDIFLELLGDRFPEVAVDAEEDTEVARRFRRAGEPLVVLDPIDGTLSYLSGSRDWAVMAGLIRGERFEAACIHYPALDLTLEARAGRGATLRSGDGPPEPVALPSGAPGRVLVGPRYPEEPRAALAAEGVVAETCRCSAVEGAALLLGRADGALTDHPVDRRHATALFASVAAGAAVSFGDARWTGEDPEAHRFEGPTALAARPEDAERWVALTRRAREAAGK